jgi:type II secretory pathway pseudopilin PulG
MLTLRAKIIAAGILGIALVGAYFAWKYHVEQIGAARVETRDAQAALAAMQRTLEQVQSDAKTNEDATHALQAEKDRLAATLADQPAPILRVCEPAPSSRLPTAPVAPRKPRETAPAGGSSASVPTGDQPGRDIGGELQLIAIVSDRLSAQLRAMQSREEGLNP